MQKKKCNHWVPQAYLRAFAADPDRRRKIWRFGRTGGDPELKPIEKVAVQFYLYAPQNDNGGRDYSFEDKLADLENWFSGPVWLKLTHEMVDLQREPLRKLVALMVAVMYLRNLSQLEETRALHRQFVDMFSRYREPPSSVEYDGTVYSLDASTWPAYRDATDNDLKRHWVTTVGSAAWLAEILTKMRWAVIFTDMPIFITTDHPVTILHPSLRFGGLNDPETKVMFPLSPTRILWMDNRHGEPDAHYYPLRHDPAHTNLLLWRNAIEYMFSPRHPDLVCAELLDTAENMGLA